MFTLAEAHKDWYRDGIEVSHKFGPEELWRLDVDEHIQVQLAAKPVYWDLEADDFCGPDDHWENPRLFIERDTRCDHKGESIRVYYACDAWPLTEAAASYLLTSPLRDAAHLLRGKFDHVMALPNQPGYCDPIYLDLDHPGLTCYRGPSTDRLPGREAHEAGSLLFRIYTPHRPIHEGGMWEDPIFDNFFLAVKHLRSLKCFAEIHAICRGWGFPECRMVVRHPEGPDHQVKEFYYSGASPLRPPVVSTGKTTR